jgi:hypothetical protein
MPSKQPGKVLPTGKLAFSASSNPGGSRVPYDQKASGNRPAHQPIPAGRRVPDWRK